MGDKRMKTIFTDKHNQEALHVRYKSAIAALNDLMKDAALVKHRKTLDEVSKAMTRALEQDQKWSTRFKMLQAELDSNESRMKIALELSERDKNLINSLQKDLKTARNDAEELKSKSKDSFRRSIIESGEENDEKRSVYTERGRVSEKIELNSDNSREVKRKTSHNERLLEEMTKNQDKLQNEIEQMKLQVFELEEEKTNKENIIEDLKNTLNSKSKQLKDVTAKLKELADKDKIIQELRNQSTSTSKQLNDVIAENIVLKKLSDEVKSLNKSDAMKNDKNFDNTSINSKEQKLKEAISSLRKKLQDISKRDQRSLEKVKQLIKKNTILSEHLKRSRNHNNLMKLELQEKTKMLDLLSCQYCKLEEKGQKQVLTITELENIRNKYVHRVGNLEQEIHEMRKSNKV